MGARKWVVVLTVFALLTGQTPAATKRPAGMVLVAGKARLDSAEALPGSNVFAGQELSTEPGGTLRIRLGEGQIALAGRTAVRLVGGDEGLRAVLRHGTVNVAWKRPTTLTFSVAGLSLHPQGEEPAYASVTLVSPHELVITSYSGTLSASFAGTTHIIPAGSIHKATLPPQGPQGAGKSRGLAPIVWVAIGAAAATGVGLWLALRDGQQTVSPSVS